VRARGRKRKLRRLCSCARHMRVRYGTNRNFKSTGTPLVLVPVQQTSKNGAALTAIAIH